MVQSILQPPFIFVLVSVVIVAACLILWLITMAIGYRIATGEKKEVMGPKEFMKVPVLFLFSYLFYHVFIPFFWRLRIEKTSLASMYLFFGTRNFWVWLLLIFIAILIGIFSSQLGGNTNKPKPLSGYLLTLIQCLLIGLTEEFLFRLFLTGRLALIVSPWIAVGIASLVFLLFHFQTPAGTVKRAYYYMYVIMVSFFLGFEYFYFQSIWICVISHFLIDFLSFTLPPLLKKKS
ncbi:MAG: CPBP family intramembrane metalloprotease [Caldisericia bacterium]|nr:CPBP family intramembrane metalloprotease [Caldisericia bacterium]